MTKNTSYYKAAFAKSEAASPYAKMNPHMKVHHGDTSMNMKTEMGKRKQSPPDPGTGLTKKYGTHTKMAGATHMLGKVQGKGSHEDHHKDVTDREGKFPKDEFEKAIEKKVQENE